MRILILTDQFPPAEFGGMAQHAWHMAQYLGQRHDVVVVTLRGHGSAVHADAPFIVRPAFTKRFPTIDSYIAAHVAKRFKADVVHACTAGLDFRQLSTTWPVVTRVVGNDFLRPWYGYNLPLRSILYRLPGDRVKRALERMEKGLRRTQVLQQLRADDMVVANSSWTRDCLLTDGVTPERIKVIVGGVDIEVFHPCSDRARVREKLKLPCDAPVILSAGNLFPKKGIDTVTRVVARLTNWPTLRYVVVGDGPEEERLQQLATEIGLAERVLFVGRRDQAELALYYQAADVYVLASQEETMGRVYIEAGACGIPVVGGRVGGVPDVVHHGENGLLVDNPEDEAAIADSIERLLRDAGMRARMGAAGLKRAREEFSWEAVGAEFERLLTAVAQRKADRTTPRNEV